MIRQCHRAELAGAAARRTSGIIGPTMRALATVVLAASVLANAAPRSDDRVAAFGKQRAAASGLAWEIRDAGHPLLGPIRFAHTTTPVTTSVGPAKVYSNAYVSCEKKGRTIAIELTNQISPDDPGGLAPATMPRLVCISPAARGAGTAQQVFEARWEVNGYGDAMARGLQPAALRACAAIGIVQDVALPAGWARRTLPVAFEITPYSRDLDAIFAACGETSAYTPAIIAAPKREPPAAAREPAHPAAWRNARTIAGGATNVRAGPSVHSAVVARLDANAAVLVQPAGGDWWRARSRTGHKFEGYIRVDRLVIK